MWNLPIIYKGENEESKEEGDRGGRKKTEEKE